MDGVILSHTKMGGSAICTNIAVNVDGKHRQLRARIAPNRPIIISHFGYSAKNMNAYWQPGRTVTIDGFTEMPADLRRSTHPEDVYIVNPGAAEMKSALYMGEGLIEVVLPFTYPSFRRLYPNLRKQTTNEKGWMDPAVENSRSVGYVWCDVCVLPSEANGKQFVRVTDASGYTFVCSLKDEALAERIRSRAILPGRRFENVLVRFSLSDRLEIPEVGERCYVMVSHVVI